MSNVKRLLCCLLLGALVSGCGHNSRSILYAGIQSELGGRVPVSDSQARTSGQHDLAEWQIALTTRASHFPRQHFRNLPESTFLARLRAAARHYEFTLIDVRFYRPRQLAPFIRVQTRHYLELSHALFAIERSLDPHRGKSDLSGWTYEGFYFEGDDERGFPFVIVSNLTRGQVEGSQFGRSEELYPFAHG